MPATPEDLLAYLANLGVEHETHTHEAAHTVEEAKAYRGDIPGLHAKNLFVKDKKSRLFLLVLEEEAPIDLKRAHERVGASGRFSFGSAEQLEALLGVRPGSVTPFGAINDTEHRVTIAIDADFLKAPRINCHPLVNTRTTSLTPAGLLTFLRATGHEPLIVALADLS